MLKSALAVAALAAFAAPAFAIEIPLPNGSFEVGAPTSNNFGFVTNWTTQSLPSNALASGVFTTYAGFSPSQGARMALITNANTGGGIQITNFIVNANPIQLFDFPYLNFHFAFLTTDATSTALADRDPFHVTVDYFSDAAGNNQTGSQTFVVNTGNLVAASGPPNGVAPNPFGTTSLNVTTPQPGVPNSALQLAVLNLNYPSGTGYARVSFHINNTGTSVGGVSGVLIDNVFINPEPGTMALFGLGAAGLGAMVWRRRKAKLLLEAAKA